MSAAPRLRAGTILVLAAFAVLPIVGLVPSCGTGAVGVDACRSIESARCDALVSCPKEQHGITEDQAATCKLFYRDDCLHGIENDAGADAALTNKDACVNAIAATAACAKSGAKIMADCAGVKLVPTANAAAVSPCDMLAGSVVGNKVSVGGVELLANCNFVAAPVDGGATSSASSSSGSSSSAAGGGASSSSSTSSASASSSASSASSSSASSSAAGGGGGPGDASPE